MSAVVIELEHTPHRPSWDCNACGEPWPCEPAREALAAALDEIDLAMYAWQRLEEAAGELVDLPLREFFARFIKWTRHSGSNRRPV